MRNLESFLTNDEKTTLNEFQEREYTAAVSTVATPEPAAAVATVATPEPTTAVHIRISTVSAKKLGVATPPHPKAFEHGMALALIRLHLDYVDLTA